MPGLGPAGAQLARYPGTVLSLPSLMNILAPVVPLVTPPLFWLDGQDIDGFANSTLVDGGQVATWINKGIFLNAGARVPFTKTGGNLFFRKIAGAMSQVGLSLPYSAGTGRLSGLSTVQSDNTGILATAAIPALPNPYTMMVVVQMNQITVSGGFQGVLDGLGASRGGMFVHTNDGIVDFVGGGGSSFATTAKVFGAQYNIVTMVFNGASSFCRVNGVQSANVSPVPVALTGLTLFTLVGGAFAAAQDIPEYFFLGDATSYPAYESYLAAKYAGFPQ